MSYELLVFFSGGYSVKLHAFIDWRQDKTRLLKKWKPAVWIR